MANDIHRFYDALNRVSGLANEFADQFWDNRGDAVNHELMLKIRPRRAQGHQEILQLVNEFRSLQQTLGQQEDLQIRLALWLCSFFLGFPLFHLWERIRHLDPVVDGYAGTGALYDKLAGDVYRGERKVRDRICMDPRGSPNAAFNCNQPLLVLAFSPTALLPDEDWDPDGEQHQGTDRAQFLGYLRHLAGRYLRLQMWLYFSSGYPIRYAFVIEHAARAVAKHFQNHDATDIRTALEDRFRKMGGDKDKLFGVYRTSDERDIWTSCTFGVEDGVLSDSPQAHLSHRHFMWLMDDSLKVSREKLVRLTQDRPVLSGDDAMDALVRNAVAVRASATAAPLHAAAPA